MKKIILTLFLCLTLCACTSVEEVDLEKLMQENEYVILDVRTKEEYAEGYIEGAINVPLNEIESTNKLKDKDQIIFVYCRSGNRSKQASEILANLGYTNIYEIGGINTWEE